MNLITRGIRNAFRNGVRTLSIIVILGLSIGLSLTMLVAHKAVDNKIADIKRSVGNNITIAPAGFSGFSSVNNALTSDQLKKVKSIAHVTNLTETLSDHLTTIGSAQPGGGPFGKGGDNTGDNSNNQTSLTSPVKLNSNGDGSFGSGGGDGPRLFISGGGGGGLPANFSPPIEILGTTDPSHVSGSTATLKSGKLLDGSKDSSDALISTAMATKNNLKVGSTFTAYGATLTIAGIFDTGTQSGNNTIVVSLPALQRLSAQAGSVTDATATVDSLDHLAGATSAIKTALGSSADVQNSQAEADNTVKPLDSVRTVSLFSLIGAVVAGAVIILLVMIMVVRERKREIGVVKAIGGSNIRIMAEFMVEALTLTILGAIIGLLIGVIGGQPVTKLLVNNSTSSSTNSDTPGGKTLAGGGELPKGGFGQRFRSNTAVKGLDNINTQIGWGILLDGFGAAVLIAALGSALASGMISKVRPSEVLRSE